MQLGLLVVPTVCLTLASGQHVPATKLEVNSSLFLYEDLKGYEIISPLTFIPVISPGHCVLACLTTTGCTSVAMSDYMCQSYDGAVRAVSTTLYTSAYRILSNFRCAHPSPVAESVKVFEVHPRPNGHAVLACTPGYVGLETRIDADSSCVWTGPEPECHRCYEWRGNCYYFNLNGTTWYNSQARCEAFGGRLTDITSTEEKTFLAQTMGTLVQQSSPYWIGGTRSNGTFVWYHSMENIPPLFYGVGQPTLEIASDCIWLFNQFLGNEPCHTILGYICKVPL